jgi:hypothetical protein
VENKKSDSSPGVQYQTIISFKKQKTDTYSAEN